MKRILFIATVFLLAGQLFTGCSPKSSNTTPPATKLMLVHASAKSPALDYYISNDGYNYRQLGTRSYQNSTGYLDATAGTYAIIADTTNQEDAVILTGQFANLGGGGGHTMFFLDSSALVTRSVLVAEDLTKAGVDSAGVRFFHFAPGAPKLDVFISNTTTPDFSNRDFLYLQSNDANIASTRFSRVTKGTHTISIRKAGTSEELYSLPVNMEATKLYTLFVSGFVSESGERGFSAKLLVNE